jgi:hypothetical protein
LFVIDVEFKPINGDRLFDLRSSCGSADYISNHRVRFEKKLSVDSALGLRISRAGPESPGMHAHEEPP